MTKHFKVKETMNYCPDCKRVWEIVKQNNGSHGKLVYYNDFPTYGKPKETCPACLTKNVVNLISGRNN